LQHLAASHGFYSFLLHLVLKWLVWFVDIFLNYLFRVMIHTTAAKVTVTDSACPKAVYGCDVAEVHYTYRVDGELYPGSNERLLSFTTGGSLLKAFRAGTEFFVRLKPQNRLVANGISSGGP